MHRCLISADMWEAGEIPLPEPEAHHLTDVLRARAGDRVEAFDGRGRVAEAVVARAVRGHRRAPADAVIALREEPRRVSPPLPRIVLLQAVPKGSRMDYLVEKAVELGVWEIVPLQTARGIARPGETGHASRPERWRRIAESAARQCGTAWLPHVGAPVSFDAALARLAACDHAFLAALGPGTTPLREAIGQISGGGPDVTVAVLIGPEGDFTPEEIAQGRSAGALPVSLGSLTLRVETAALYAVSVLRYALGG
jgi:16S rRNA (uracil1498-N3)-methyltransferase